MAVGWATLTWAAQIRVAVRLLEANQLLAPQPPAPIIWNTTAEGLPICPKHGASMKRREKQGDGWYSHTVGTEDRPLSCRGYAGKDSPGYER